MRFELIKTVKKIFSNEHDLPSSTRSYHASSIIVVVFSIFHYSFPHPSLIYSFIHSSFIHPFTIHSFFHQPFIIYSTLPLIFPLTFLYLHLKFFSLTMKKLTLFFLNFQLFMCANNLLFIIWDHCLPKTELGASFAGFGALLIRFYSISSLIHSSFTQV